MRGTVASWVSCTLVFFGSACASQGPKVAAAPSSNDAVELTAASPSDVPRTGDQPDRSDARPEPESIPTTCAENTSKDPKEAKLCLVGSDYTKKLCAGVYPELALAFFAKGTPWTRVYLAGDIEAWNASGGRTHRAQLAFDEEVIVLARHGATGGIVMTGSGVSYDVLRWDGSCVSISQSEMTTRKPPSPKTAVVPWKRLDVSARRVLLASERVKASSDALEKACSSPDEKACEKGTRTLSLAIAEHVRSGGALAPPPRRP